MPENHPSKKGRPRGSASFGWRAFFHQSTTPIYVLGKNRRLRFANAAWEKLTGVKLADAVGMVCTNRRSSTPLAAALAPTREAQHGRSDRSRRASPSGRAGSQWWDVSFVPLMEGDALCGLVCFINVVGDADRVSARKLPPFLAELRERHASHFTLELFSGASLAAIRFVAQLRNAAESAAPVWLVGEPGSGKETAARVIHHAGPRRERAFIAIDCEGLQPFLIESLLFGRGALLDSMQVGTLYLKSPASLPRDLQQRLTDYFSEPEHPVPRLISGLAATAAREIAAGQLVPDFHTAFSVLELQVPPLRERIADLPRLAASLAPAATFDPVVLEMLALQPWPGNFREFAEVLQSVSSAAKSGTVKVEHLPHALRVRAGLEAPPAAAKSLNISEILAAIEKRLIELAMRKANGHQGKAAELLGVYRARLSRRLEALRILPKPEAGA